ncbi:MAG: STAS domain-containing protein [Gammaproteobacteria bacterium]
MEDFSFVFEPAAKTIQCKFAKRMDGIMINRVMDAFKIKIGGLLDSGVSAEELKINFDLSGVDYISSGFLRLCISSAKDVKKGNFSIINTAPEVLKVFKISGLEEQLNVS